MVAPQTSPAMLSYSQRFGAKPAAGAPRKSVPSSGSKRDVWKDGDMRRKEVVHRCAHCQLPLGERVCTVPSLGEEKLHNECGAQLILQDLARGRKESRAKQEVLKESQRKEFDIGWTPQRIPDATKAAKCINPTLQKSLHCLVADLKRKSVDVAYTAEPAAAVNLEYLALALRVRRAEGREPLFSLDPVPDPATDSRFCMQAKRFEPQWLAGTSAGEVMFQADYQLKALSMGEGSQPVLGMKSCLELSSELQEECTWNAREWFIIKDAEIFMSKDHVLVPDVVMGVEARCQCQGASGELEDARLTEDTHPLARYAANFTHNFELIAERRSAIFHLRELAKATALAKFLMEATMSCSSGFSNLADQRLEEVAGMVYSMEVPQLWNDRLQSQVEDKTGRVLQANARYVYGGVQFGLDGITLGRAPSLRAATPMMSIGAFSARAPSLAARAPSLQAAAPFGAIGAFSARAPSLAARAPSLRAAAPMGVDLSLGGRNLSQVALPPANRWASSLRCAAPAETLSADFWKHIDIDDGGDQSLLAASDVSLLRQVFHSKLCDRRQDGDLFVPPETSHDYVQKLQSLVKEEVAIQQKRREKFLSVDFSRARPGPLFPQSWTSEVQMVSPSRAAARATTAPSSSSLSSPAGSDDSAPSTPRSSLSSLSTCPSKSHAAVKKWALNLEELAPSLQPALRSLTPEFEETTEDGAKYRIYSLGAMEVRTIQEDSEKKDSEMIGAVFSHDSGIWQEPPGSKLGEQQPSSMQKGKYAHVDDDDRVVEAVQYVEDAPRAASDLRNNQATTAGGYRFFIMLSMGSGNTVLIEEATRSAWKLTWLEGCAGLSMRVSLAKEFRRTPSSSEVTSVLLVKDVKSMVERFNHRAPHAIHDLFMAMSASLT